MAESSLSSLSSQSADRRISVRSTCRRPKPVHCTALAQLSAENSDSATELVFTTRIASQLSHTCKIDPTFVRPIQACFRMRTDTHPGATLGGELRFCDGTCFHDPHCIATVAHVQNRPHFS